MNRSKNTPGLTPIQKWGLVILRIFIGWHLLYEGIVKLIDPGWTSEGYLLGVRGFLSPIFEAMATNPSILAVVDFLNIWGLILIGLGLFLGIFARVAVYAGIILLAFYYIAYPPFQNLNFGAPQEGNYLLIDKTFIELFAMIVLAMFPRTLNIGLGNLFGNFRLNIPRLRSAKSKIRGNPQPAPAIEGNPKSRRNMLKNLSFLPFMGAFIWGFSNDKKHTGVDAFSGSTYVLDRLPISQLEGQMPMGTLVKGKKPVSRLILGTNIFSGTAHARDLIYARSLFRAYNTEKKIFETYLLAEQAGINLVYWTPLLEKYRKIFGSNFQTWSNVAPTRDDIYSQVDRAIDNGVEYILIQGAATDRRVYDGDIDVISKCVDYIKRQGYPVGLGSHTIQAMIACEEAGIECDFYYKTLHHDNYWSAHPMENRRPFLWSSNISPDHNEFHDNMWCLFPDKTIEFIQRAQKPVVGFKVLAGGAIHPKEGFQFAFDNGADFIEVGMFDFQIVEDVNICIRSFENAGNRIRPWYG